MAKSKKKKTLAESISKHVLYEASVQGVEVDHDFFQKVYNERNGCDARLLREDFCGTALLSCEWVQKHPENKAWGVDLEPLVLDYSKQNRLPGLGDDAKRLKLIQGDACQPRRPFVDIVCALNFSYSVFKQRSQMLDYFKAAHKSLRKEGLFILDAWGGSGTLEHTKDKRDVEKFKDANGNKVPGFEYIWDQAYFNHVNNNIICHIHFKITGWVKNETGFHLRLAIVGCIGNDGHFD